MAETSYFVTGAAAAANSDVSLTAAQNMDNSNMSWLEMFHSNQDYSTGSSSSVLYEEWGHVLLGKSSKTRKRKDDVASNSTVHSSTDLSMALSAISAELSLSSSASSSSHSSSERDHQSIEKEEEVAAEFKMSTEDGKQAMSTSDADKRSQNIHFEVPKLGMVFSSDDEAYNFYKGYAKEVGFCVRKAKVRRLSSGDIRERYFFCSKEGFRSEKQTVKRTKFKRKETRIGCKARIRCIVEDGRWVITEFIQEHNHQLEGRDHIKGSCATASKVPTNNETNMPTTDGRAAKNCVKFCNEPLTEVTRDLLSWRLRKRMLALRESPRRSRMRKQKHLEDLMSQVVRLRKENQLLVTSINTTSQRYLNVEADNSILRAQIGELSHRLASLDKIISHWTASSSIIAGVYGGEPAANNFLNPLNTSYLNQPIMASAAFF